MLRNIIIANALLATAVPVQAAVSTPNLTCSQLMTIRDKDGTGSALFDDYAEQGVGALNDQHVLGPTVSIDPYIMSKDDKGSWLAAYCFSHPNTQYADAERALYDLMAKLQGVTHSAAIDPSSPPSPSAVTSNPSAPPATDQRQSVQIDGWPQPGQTTAHDVLAKMGPPLTENRSDPLHNGEYVWLYARQDRKYIFTFLFDKDDHVVCMLVYKDNSKF